MKPTPANVRRCLVECDWMTHESELAPSTSPVSAEVHDDMRRELAEVKCLRIEEAQTFATALAHLTQAMSDEVAARVRSMGDSQYQQMRRERDEARQRLAGIDQEREQLAADRAELEAERKRLEADRVVIKRDRDVLQRWLAEIVEQNATLLEAKRQAGA